VSGSPSKQEFRCQAKCRRTQEQCGKYALKGSNYCQFHGGRSGRPRKKGLDLFYANHLKGTLRERLEAWATLPHNEQVKLYEELALSRSMALEACKLAEKALASGDDKLKLLAGSAMRDAIGFVTETAMAVSKLESMATDKLSLNAIDLYVTQICRVIANHVPEETARLIEAEIKESVQLPLGAKDELAAPPAESALEMDDVSAPPTSVD
jgi:hypothetical protein